MKPYLALKASAGSGKTFALTVRYISLGLASSKRREIYRTVRANVLPLPALAFRAKKGFI